MSFMSSDELPPEVIQEAARRINDYCVFLLSLMTIDGKEEVELIGSGTLISCGSSFGIATAHHVISSPKYQCAEQIGLVTRSTTHRITFPKVFLSEVVVGEPLSGTNRPDLAFIKLPQATIGSLRAHKSFWDIERWRKRIDEIELPEEAGLWFLFGSPVHSMGIRKIMESSREKLLFPGIAGYSGVPSFFDEDDFDYLEFPIEMPEAVEEEKDFRGVSGGGIWQVQLIRKSAGNIAVGEYIYSGVPFYQTELDDKRNRKILCHGRKSIYEKLYSAIAND